MKKIIAGSLIVISSMFLTGCGNNIPSLDSVTKKGLTLNKGMTKAQVMKLLKREPDSR